MSWTRPESNQQRSGERRSNSKASELVDDRGSRARPDAGPRELGGGDLLGVAPDYDPGMCRFVMIAALLCSCGKAGKEDRPEGPEHVAWHAPIRSDRMTDNPYAADADPRNAFAIEVDQLFAHGPEAGRATAVYDGTTTLFLRFPGCSHDELARRLQVIGAAKAKAAGFEVLACADVEAAIAIR